LPSRLATRRARVAKGKVYTATNYRGFRCIKDMIEAARMGIKRRLADATAKDSLTFPILITYNDNIIITLYNDGNIK
jgi:hypothetical protein